jgi:hypothetical protein
MRVRIDMTCAVGGQLYCRRRSATLTKQIQPRNSYSIKSYD